jgi:hypothetical protein
MTTLRKLASQVIRLLSAGPKTKDSKLSEAYIQTEIRQVTHKLIKGEWFASKNDNDHVVNHLYVGTYRDIEVQLDEDRNRCYALLPCYPIALPNHLGIQEVKPQTTNVHEYVAMIPINPQELELFRSLNVGQEILSDQWTYEPARDRVWFTERNDETLLDAGIEDVEMRLVVIDPAQIDENDNYPIDPALEIDLIKEVLMLHGYTTKEAADLINDSVPAK